MKVTRFDILWCVFFSGLATGIAVKTFDINPILAGALVGAFGTIIAYILLRIYDRNKNKSDQEYQ